MAESGQVKARSGKSHAPQQMATKAAALNRLEGRGDEAEVGRYQEQVQCQGER